MDTTFNNSDHDSHSAVQAPESSPLNRVRSHGLRARPASMHMSVQLENNVSPTRTPVNIQLQ